jgi:hypothetical protein
MDLNNSLTQIILGIIAAIIGTGLIFRFAINKNKNSGSVNIKKSKIKGDVAGRDIKK